jgi:hypothetical protein
MLPSELTRRFHLLGYALIGSASVCFLALTAIPLANAYELFDPPFILDPTERNGALGMSTLAAFLGILCHCATWKR